MNKYSKRIYKTTKNLLTGSTEKDEEYQAKAKENVVEIISYWHPNMTINLVDDHTPWQPNAVPPPLNECNIPETNQQQINRPNLLMCSIKYIDIEFDKASGKYYPILYLNDYWNLNADYQPINATLSHLNLSLTFSHLQLWKWQLYLSQGMKNQWYANVFQDDTSDEDQDTIKVIFSAVLDLSEIIIFNVVLF